MKKKTTLTKMHIAPSTVRYDAVAARDSNEVGQILAGTRKRNGYSLVTFSELLRHYGVDVSDKGISKWEKGYTTPSIYQLVAICYALNIKEGPSYFTKNFQKPALLNDIGQKKVAEYEMDLIASRRYQPDAEKWIALMKECVNPTELTAELLNTLIEKIVVHEAVKGEDGSREQEVEIFYRFIGKID